MLFRLPSLLLAASATLLSACSNDDKSSSSSLTGFDNSIYSHLTATEATVCAQTKTGILKCWGNGDDYGTLGVIDYFDTTIGDADPAPEMGYALQAVPVFVSDES